MLTLSHFLTETPKYYIGIVDRGSVHTKKFAELRGSTSHWDEFPNSMTLPSQHFRYDGRTGTMSFNDIPTRDDYFTVLDYLDGQHVPIKWYEDPTRRVIYKQFDVRLLPESVLTETSDRPLSRPEKLTIGEWQLNDRIPAKTRKEMEAMLKDTVLGGSLAYLRPSMGTKVWRGQDNTELQLGARSFSTKKKDAKGWGRASFELTITNETLAIDLSKICPSENEVVVFVKPTPPYELNESYSGLTFRQFLTEANDQQTALDRLKQLARASFKLPAGKSAVIDSEDIFAHTPSDPPVHGWNDLVAQAHLQNISLKTLIPTQDAVTANGIEHYIKMNPTRWNDNTEDPVNILTKGGKFWLLAGHHRCAAAILMGYPTVQAEVRSA